MIKKTAYQKLSKETDTSLFQNEPSLGEIKRREEKQHLLRKSYGRKSQVLAVIDESREQWRVGLLSGNWPIVSLLSKSWTCGKTLSLHSVCSYSFSVKKTSVHLCLCGSIFSFLPAVSSFSTLSTYCYWCGLEAACLTIFPLLLTYTFRSSEMFSSFCWFCLVPLKAIMFARRHSFLWWFAVPDTSRCIYNCTWNVCRCCLVVCCFVVIFFFSFLSFWPFC